MFTKTKLVGSIISFLLQLFGWLMDALGITSMFGKAIPFGWIGLAGSIIFAGFMSWLVWGYYSQLRNMQNSKPNIVFRKVEEHFEGKITTRRWSSETNQWLIGQSETAYFTRIWIANEPLKPIQSIDAVKLYGEISFYIAGSLLFEMGGRWAETKEIADGGQPIDIDQIDIPPNGRPFCMDIGLKYYDEDEFYGYNNETPRKTTKGFRDQDRKLMLGTYFVKTRFRCKGADTLFWFRLENSGKGNHVKFTIMPTPPIE